MAIWIIYIRKGIYNQLETAFGQQNTRIKKIEQIIYYQQQQQQDLIQMLQPAPIVHPYMGIPNIPVQPPVVQPAVVQPPVVQPQPQTPTQSVKPVEMDSVPLSPKIINPPSSPKVDSAPQESIEDLDALLKEELAELEKSNSEEYEEPIEEIVTDSLKKTT